MKRRILLLAMISICSLVAQNATAGAHLVPETVGFQVGLVSPEDLDATAGLGAVANHGLMTRDLRLVSHLDFWSHSEDLPFSGGTASVNDVTLGARGEYAFATKSRWTPFAGAGLGLHFLHAKVEPTGFPAVKDASTKLGVDLGGGVTTPINPRTEFRSELWYGIVDSYSQWSLKAGLAFKLGS